MESKDQEPNRRYITFFNPEDTLDMSKNWFNSDEVFIPSLGPTHLNLQRAGVFYDDNGYLINHSGTSKVPADMLSKAGFYNLTLCIDALQDTNRKLVCHLLIDNIDSRFNSEFGYYNDELDPDPLRKYSAMTENWKKDGEDEVVEIFLPPDPKILANLKFYFETQD